MATKSERETIKQLTKKVMISCRIMSERGVTRGAFGHVSARIPGTDRVLIKSKGPAEEALEFTAEKDIITIDIQGNVLKAAKGKDAPQETAMHLAVYRARHEVMSVIHTHPDWIVALTAAEKPLLPIYAAYNPQGLRLFLEGIPLYHRSVTIVNDELGADFMKTMGDKKACLLIGHGMTAAGGSVEEATLVTMNVFELARLNYMAYAIGQPKAIPQVDIDEYSERWVRRARRSEPRGEPSDWRHYKKSLGRRK